MGTGRPICAHQQSEIIACEHTLAAALPVLNNAQWSMVNAVCCFPIVNNTLGAALYGLEEEKGIAEPPWPGMMIAGEEPACESV